MRQSLRNHRRRALFNDRSLNDTRFVLTDDDDDDYDDDDDGQLTKESLLAIVCFDSIHFTSSK